MSGATMDYLAVVEGPELAHVYAYRGSKPSRLVKTFAGPDADQLADDLAAQLEAAHNRRRHACR